MPWRQVTFNTTRERAESLSDLLHEQGALSVTLQDSADQPLFEPGPGETPLWEQVQVVALFEDDVDLDPVLAQLRDQCNDIAVTVTRLEDEDWERAWLKDFHPMRFGERLWIVPTTYDPPDADAVNIRLDPGLAFGSGTHPTTALCLEWLDRHLQPGVDVIDYGCGSGILAIAAIKLGARHAWAVDIDPQALDATYDNAKRNQVAQHQIDAMLPEALAVAPVDLLMANILANPLVELAPHLAGLVKDGGNIVLSGILKDQAEAIIARYEAWFDDLTIEVKDDWVCIAGRKR